MLIAVGALAFFTRPQMMASAQSIDAHIWISGSLLDEAGQPVVGARIRLTKEADENALLSEGFSQNDGQYTLLVPQPLPAAMTLHIERPHFQSTEFSLTPAMLASLASGETLVLSPITLQRRTSAAFWIATGIFILVLVFIATDIFHNTLSALIGTALIFLVSYFGEPLSEELYIFDFARSLTYIDWNVIFLIMGMMIVIAVIENTGIFQWLAFVAYRLSGGRMMMLLPIFMLITGVASAFLDNVTTMLLMTPISVQIALAVGINPLALLIPEVMASNVIGVSTLVGTPTNILIGSYGQISFNDFLENLTPGVLLAFVGLIGYSLFVYRGELAQAHSASELLTQKLSERARITEPEHLKKAGIIGAIMLAMFIFGERIHLLPAVTAITGATALMVWIRPNIDEMIDAVDWTTLVFFMSLFIVVGAIQEVGLISQIALFISRMVGENLLLAMLSIIWLSALLSMVVANIPFTAAMLPVIGFLSATIPGAENKVLFFCLSVGAAMGGNGSLIGASANMVTAGIAESAGYPIRYNEFLRKGFPALLITVGLATLWLMWRFL